MTLTRLAKPWENPAAGIRPVFLRLCQITSVTPAGWMCLAAGVLALALGLGFGWLEFSVAGALAVVTVAVALLFTIGRPRLGVQMRLAAPRVVVGQPAQAELVVRNESTRRHFGSRLDVPVGDGIASFALPLLAPGAGSSHGMRLPTHRRGVVRIGPVSSVQGDIFALTGRETRWNEAVELFVHPRTVPLPGRQSGFVHDLEGHPSSHVSASDINFHALRSYVPGDDRRHVHWRSTARAGRLMVRQYEETRMSRVSVALDTGRTAYLDEDEFELAVSCAASLTLQSIYAESQLTLLTATQLLPAVSAQRALDSMATVALSGRGGIVELIRYAMQHDPTASVALCVTGSTVSLKTLHHACQRFDVDVRVVGIRVEVDAALRARSAGNVTVLQVGSLEQLPRALRKAME